MPLPPSEIESPNTANLTPLAEANNMTRNAHRGMQRSMLPVQHDIRWYHVYINIAACNL